MSLLARPQYPTSTPLNIVIFGRYAAEYSTVLDNASRRGVTGIDKELFMQLFQEARREVFTNRLCRSAFRSTGIHLYNPEAVLKNIPELKTTENSIGTRWIDLRDTIKANDSRITPSFNSS
jgi:hypothetical protein